MSVLPQDETGKAEHGYSYDFDMQEVAIYVDDGAGGVVLWDGKIDAIVTGDLYLALDEVEDLLQSAPVDRSNPAFALSYTGNNLTQVDMTVQGVTYRKTLTYTGIDLTGVSAWVEV